MFYEICKKTKQFCSILKQIFVSDFVMMSKNKFNTIAELSRGNEEIHGVEEQRKY
jgi:hypothetical protein